MGERNARSKLIYLRKTAPVFHITQHAIETKLISRYILVVESGYGDQDAWHPYFLFMIAKLISLSFLNGFIISQIVMCDSLCREGTFNMYHSFDCIPVSGYYRPFHYICEYLIIFCVTRSISLSRC